MVNAPSDLVSLPGCSEAKVITMDDFSDSSTPIQNLATQLIDNQLNSLDLIECVLGLAETAIADDVKVFTDMMVNKAPELVFLGFLQSKVRLSWENIKEKRC